MTILDGEELNDESQKQLADAIAKWKEKRAEKLGISFKKVSDKLAPKYITAEEVDGIISNRLLGLERGDGQKMMDELKEQTRAKIVAHVDKILASGWVEQQMTQFLEGKLTAMLKRPTTQDMIQTITEQVKDKAIEAAEEMVKNIRFDGHMKVTTPGRKIIT